MSRFVVNEEFLDQVELLSLAIKDNVAGLFGGNHKSKKYGSSSEFADHREYQEGDEITKIDWNVYARFDKLYLKLFLDERQMHNRIYIDASSSMNFNNKANRALELATVLAYLSIKAMDKVSIYYLDGNQAREVFTNVIGKDAFMNSIVKLNDIEFNGEVDISTAITSVPVGYGDGNSIIISDFLTNNNYENAIDYLREKKRDVLCLQVLSEEELDPFTRGKVIIHDGENHTRTYKKNVNKDVINAYKLALNDVQKRIKDYCNVREANYLLCSTNDSLKDIFLDRLVTMEVIK